MAQGFRFARWRKSTPAFALAAIGVDRPGGGDDDHAGETIELRPGGFTKTCLVAGSGRQPEEGELCAICYTGRLDSGAVFDSSHESGRKAFVFHLGMAEVIKGWDIGIATMFIGEKAILHIPSDYAYGNRAMGPKDRPLIPAKADLTFEVELLAARDDTFDKIKWQLLGLVLFEEDVLLPSLLVIPEILRRL